MSLFTLFAALLYFGGLVLVIVGLRSLLSRAWSPHAELRPPSEMRRAARIDRVEAARRRGWRIIESEPSHRWGSDDDPGPMAA